MTPLTLSAILNERTEPARRAVARGYGSGVVCSLESYASFIHNKGHNPYDRTQPPSVETLARLTAPPPANVEESRREVKRPMSEWLAEIQEAAALLRTYSELRIAAKEVLEAFDNVDESPGYTATCMLGVLRHVVKEAERLK